MRPQRLAAIAGEKRRRETHNTYHAAIDQGIQECHEREPKRLQIVHLQCNAEAVTTGNRCKLAGPRLPASPGDIACVARLTHAFFADCACAIGGTGPYVHCGLNYCKRHLNVVTGNEALNRHGDARQQADRGANADLKLLLFEPTTECVMCFTRIPINDLCATNCGHFFHYHCMRSWMQRSTTCPVCKKATQQLRSGNRRCKVVVEIKPKQIY